MPWVPRLLTVVPVMALNSSVSQLQLFQVQYQSNFLVGGGLHILSCIPAVITDAKHLSNYYFINNNSGFSYRGKT